MPEGKFADVLDEPKSKKFGDILDTEDDSDLSFGFLDPIVKPIVEGFTDEYSPLSDKHAERQQQEVQNELSKLDPEIQKALAHQVKPVREGTTFGIRNDVLTKPFQSLKDKAIESGVPIDALTPGINAVTKGLDIPFSHGIGGGAEGVKEIIGGGQKIGERKPIEGVLQGLAGTAGTVLSAMMGATPAGWAFSAGDEILRNTLPSVSNVTDKMMSPASTALEGFSDEDYGALKEGGKLLDVIWNLALFHKATKAGKWASDKIYEIRNTSPKVAEVLDKKYENPPITDERRLLPERTARFIAGEEGIFEKPIEAMDIGDIKHRTGENIPIKGTVEAVEAGKKLEGNTEAIRSLWEEAKKERIEWKKKEYPNTAEGRKQQQVDRHNIAMKDEQVMTALGAKKLQSFKPEIIESKLKELEGKKTEVPQPEEPKINEPEKFVIPDSQFGNVQQKLQAVLDGSNKPTGWMKLETPDHVILVNTETKEAVRFAIKDTKSAKEKALRNKEARDYAENNPIDKKPPPPPDSELGVPAEPPPQPKKPKAGGGIKFVSGKSREVQVQERIDELHKELADNESKLQNDIFGEKENQTEALNRKNEIAKELENLNNKVMPEAKAIDAKIEKQKKPVTKEIFPDELTELQKSKDKYSCRCSQ